MKIAFVVGLLLVSFAVYVSRVPGPGSQAQAAALGGDANSIYAKKCAGCHGKDGHGLPAWRSLGQPDFADSNWQRSVTDAQLTASISNGKGEYMPAWKGKLSDAEIKGMVATVRAFAKSS